MRTELIAAAQRGAVLGVQYGVMLIVVLAALALFLGDYQLLRQQARNGQIAFERQQQALQQQSRAAATPAPSKE